MFKYINEYNIMSGYIYCLSNLSYEDTYKIGFTRNDPNIRKSQLNTTGVLYPFKLEIAKKVLNYKDKEKQIHKLLSKYRINTNREFFKISLSEIKNIFNLIDGEIYTENITENITYENKEKMEFLKLYNSKIPANLVAFGSEDLKKILSESEIYTILNKGDESIQESIKLVHFNDMKPEYNNIYISGTLKEHSSFNLAEEHSSSCKYNKNAYIYNGSKFIVISESEALDKLTVKHYDNIKYWFNIHKETVDTMNSILEKRGTKSNEIVKEEILIELNKRNYKVTQLEDWVGYNE